MLQYGKQPIDLFFEEGNRSGMKVLVDKHNGLKFSGQTVYTDRCDTRRWRCLNHASGCNAHFYTDLVRKNFSLANMDFAHNKKCRDAQKLKQQRKDEF